MGHFAEIPSCGEASNMISKLKLNWPFMELIQLKLLAIKHEEEKKPEFWTQRKQIDTEYGH